MKYHGNGPVEKLFLLGFEFRFVFYLKLISFNGLKYKIKVGLFSPVWILLAPPLVKKITLFSLNWSFVKKLTLFV